ncbi:hypothetical protein KEM55_000882 [Ascosphaera atra]|nr:hypothetical protein KEM55_000882 [Ascosphaera atra]
MTSHGASENDNRHGAPATPGRPATAGGSSILDVDMLSDASPLSELPSDHGTPLPPISPLPAQHAIVSKPHDIARSDDIDIGDGDGHGDDDGSDSDLIDESDDEVRALLRRSKASAKHGQKRSRDGLPKLFSPMTSGLSFSHSFNSSGRLKDGERVISNSDPESDDLEEGWDLSDDGDNGGEKDEHAKSPDRSNTRVLRSATKKEEAKAAPASTHEPSSSKPTDTLPPRPPIPTTASTDTKNITFSPEVSKFANSLDALLRDSDRDREVDEKVAHAKASLARYTEEAMTADDEATREAGSNKKRLTEEFLSTLVGEDGEGGAGKTERLSRAIDRTEALDRGRTWSFFKAEDEPRPRTPPPGFPVHHVEAGSWALCLQDPASRDRAMLSGGVTDVFASSAGSLPDDILLWILRLVAYEPRESIREAYCSILKYATADRIARVFTPSCIDELFRRLGAKADALSVSCEMSYEETIPKQHTIPSRDSLLSTLCLLESISDRLNKDARSHALLLMLRLSVDEVTMSDGATCMQAQQTISSLMDKTADSTMYEISKVIYKTISHPELLAQLLANIQAFAPRVALFRCRLASAFLHQDESYLDQPVESLFDIPKLTSFLKNDPRFDVNRDKRRGELSDTPSEPIDYYELASLTSIVDIAIDNARQTSEPFASQEEETKFNNEIDALADTIKGIFSNIRDSGATHMKRLEAKEKLQMLYYRVLYGVKTRPLKKKSIFMAKKKAQGDPSIMASFLGTAMK